VVGEGLLVNGYRYEYQYGKDDERTLTAEIVAERIKALKDYDSKATIYMFVCYGNQKLNKELAKILPNPIKGFDGKGSNLDKEKMTCP
jgi:hypothetical protein